MKYVELYLQLKSEIVSGKLHENSLLPATEDLIERFGVSQTTVNRAMQKLTEEGLVFRVPSKGTFVRSRNPRQAMESRRMKRVGLLTHWGLSLAMGMEHVRLAVRGVEKRLRSEGVQLVLFPRGDLGVNDFIREIEHAQIGGALLYAIYDKAVHAALEGLRIPLVGLDMTEFGLPFDQVTTDHLLGGALAARKLRELGHDHLLFFGTILTRGRKNPAPDHKLWSMAVENELRLSGAGSAKEWFMPAESTSMMRAGVLDALLKHRDRTGYVCSGPIIAGMIRDYLESMPELSDRPRDIVHFSQPSEDRYAAGRKIWRCEWSPELLGAKGAEILTERMDGVRRKPAVHYVPVEMR